ncbi:MAG: DUF4340 domain-containing protein [Nitrospiraceae bacterium]
MTRYWPTLLMAVIFSALGFYVYFVEIPAQHSEEKQTAESRRLLAFDEAQIDGLTVKTDSGSVGLQRSSDQSWRIVSPIQADADRREVQGLIRALVTGSVKRVVEEQGGSLEAFGLSRPSTDVSISAGSQQDRVAIGDSGPLSSTLYVYRNSDQKVLLTDLAPKDFLNKSLMSFRRKELLQFNHNDVERLRLTYPQTEIVLYSQEQKPKKKWKIRYPVEAEADRTEVQALLFRLEDLKALTIVDPGPMRDMIAKTLSKPKVKVTIYAAGADQTVKIYQPDASSGEAYAEISADGPLYKVSPTSIKDLTRELFRLRDKRLLGVEADDIALLSVKTRDQQYVLIHQHDEWVLEEKPTEKVSQEIADLFVSRVVNLPAEERVLKQPAALAPYGLSAPAAEFVATGKDGKIVGKLTLGTQVGGLIYAMGLRLPGVYQARPDLLTQIPTAQSLLKPSSVQDESKP